MLTTNALRIVIPVHSFVDLITNSSSEIYVSATNGTIEALKQVINSLLKSQGITKDADELFEIKLVYTIKCEASDYDWKEFDTEAKRKKWMQENEMDDWDEYTTFVENLVIEPKDKNNAELKSVAVALHNLVYSTNAFEGQQ